MKRNHDTDILIRKLAPFFDLEKAECDSVQRPIGWLRKTNRNFDILRISKIPVLEIEVAEKEIMVSFLTEHEHFSGHDRMCLDVYGKNHVEAAADFLEKIFTKPIILTRKFKGGKMLYSASAFWVNGKQVRINATWHGRLACIFNPFAKTRTETTAWAFSGGAWKELPSQNR